MLGYKKAVEQLNEAWGPYNDAYAQLVTAQHNYNEAKGQVKARLDFNRSSATQLAREFQVASSQDPALRAEHNKAIKTAGIFGTWQKYAPKYGTESNLDPEDIQVAFNQYRETGQVPHQVLTTLAQDIEQIRIQLAEDVDGGELAA